MVNNSIANFYLLEKMNFINSLRSKNKQRPLQIYGIKAEIEIHLSKGSNFLFRIYTETHLNKRPLRMNRNIEYEKLKAIL